MHPDTNFLLTPTIISYIVNTPWQARLKSSFIATFYQTRDEILLPGIQFHLIKNRKDGDGIINVKSLWLNEFKKLYDLNHIATQTCNKAHVST